MSTGSSTRRPTSTALREHAPRPFYLVVEKILAPHEHLRADWPVEGTTGYDFLNLALGVLIDPSAEAAFDETYRTFAGVQQSFGAVATASKLRIMDNEMASELGALARAAARLADQSAMTADLTRAILQRALRQIVANFPVYRTYSISPGRPRRPTCRRLAWAFARARRGDPDLHPSAFDFLRPLSPPTAEALSAQGAQPDAALRFAMRVQQFCGPVMAKGVEDTAFYRYNRFLALNEVGGAPDRFGLAPSQRSQGRRPARRALAARDAGDRDPRHQARRGRAREIGRALRASGRVAPSGPVLEPAHARAASATWKGSRRPDRNDEYLLYQMLVGAWPMDMLENPTADALADFAGRVRSALEKSMREAKLRTGWAAPNAEYEQATLAFAAEALRPDGPGSFRPSCRSSPRSRGSGSRTVSSRPRSN